MNDFSSEQLNDFKQYCMGKEIEEEYERGYAQGCEEGKERIAELEAELTMRREQAEGLYEQWVKDTQKIVALEVQLAEANEMLEKCNSKFIVKLEAENARLREALNRIQNDEPSGVDCMVIASEALAAREGK